MATRSQRPPTEKKVEIAVECQIETFDGEAPFLSKKADGNPCPLEVSGMNDFLVDHPPVEASGKDLGRIVLPVVKPSRKARREFLEAVQIDSRGPAIHYEATARITVGPAQAVHKERSVQHDPPSHVVTIRAVARPEQHYVFLVGYAGDDASRRCYMVVTRPITQGEPTQPQVERLVRAEIENVARGRRRQDHWGIGPPLLTRHSVVLRGGAAKYTRDFRDGKETIEKNPTLAPAMTAEEFDHARSWRDPFFREFSKRGVKASYDRDEIRRAYQELVTASTSLLQQVPAGCWPAFNGPAEATRFTRQHVDGDDVALRLVAEQLTRGARRPSACDLAMRILAKQTRLSHRRLRDLIRK